MNWFSASIVGIVALVALSVVSLAFIVGGTNVVVNSSVTEIEGPIPARPFKIKTMNMVLQCPAVIQCCGIELDDVLLDIDRLTISCGQNTQADQNNNCQCKEIDPLTDPETP